MASLTLSVLPKASSTTTTTTTTMAAINLLANYRIVGVDIDIAAGIVVVVVGVVVVVVDIEVVGKIHLLDCQLRNDLIDCDLM